VSAWPPGFYLDPSGSGRFRYRSGISWCQEWHAPAGYYRSADGSLRRWDGTQWRGRYWSWWRVAVTVLLGAVTGIAELATMGGMLGDPGQGGDTPAFEHAKTLATILFLIIPIVAAGLAALIHLPYLRTRAAVRRAMERATEQAGP